MARILLALGLLLLLLVAGLGGLLLTLDVNQYKPRITAAVRDATHREFTISGDIALKPSLLPTLAINGLRLGNADWASKDALLTVQHFEARIALLPLLSRRVEISHIEIDGVHVVLETDAEGRGNWQMSAPSTAPITHPTALPSFDVRSLVVRDATLDYRAAGKPPQSVTVKQLLVRSSGTQTPLAVDLALEHDQRALSLTGEIAPLACWLTDVPCPLKLSLRSGDLALNLTGEIAQAMPAATARLSFEFSAVTLAALGEAAHMKLPAVTPLSASGDVRYGADVLTIKGNFLAGKVQLTVDGELRPLAAQPSMNVKLTLDAPALSNLGELLGKSLPTLAPVHGQAQLLGTLDALNIEQLKFTLAQSDVAGKLRIVRDQGRPRIDAQLSARYLDLSPFDPAPAKPAPKPARLLSAEPFQLSRLQQLDAHFEITADKVLSRGLPFDTIKVNGDLQGGTLTLAPFSAGLGGGKVQGRWVLQSTGPTAHLIAQTTAHQLPLRRWFDGSSGLSAPAGVAELDIKLDGQGDSVAALLGAANGHLLIDARNLEMSGKGAGMASADLVMSALSLLNPLSRNSERTHIECAVMNFPLANGRMENNTGIGLRTDQLRILGGGSIDLHSERLDIGVDPKPRAGLGLNVAGIADFVRIGGTLAAPTPVTDARGAATAGVKVGAAIASGGLSLLAEGLLDRNAADVDVCAVARGEKSINGAHTTPATQAPPTSTAGAIVQGAGKAVKGAGQAVKGAFKSLFGR